MIIFFGAGKIGRKAIEIWNMCGVSVDYLADNNADLVGKLIDGIPVLSAEQIRIFLRDVTILITCRDYQTVYEQLTVAGIWEKQIVICNTVSLIFGYALQQSAFAFQWKKRSFTSCRQRVIFDLSNGLALGGVETWSLQNVRILGQHGWIPQIIVYENEQSVCEINVKNVDPSQIIYMKFAQNAGEREKIESYLNCFIETGQTQIVCNFVGSYFMAACLAKKLYGDKVKVIAVVHNDEEVYYKNFCLYEPYIDKCLVISEKIRRTLIERNFPLDKCLTLQWEIPCGQMLERKYSEEKEPIRIGYAGRIVIVQKRVDQLIEIAKLLRSRGIDFQMELAGVGSYFKTMKEKITEEQLDKNVKLIGYLEHKEMQLFWKRQDIMVSCSEYEGHSISQCEAMAAGAVPILTDVSGVRDDIKNGENGFVTAIGVPEQIADRISDLARNKKLLSELGRKAFETIKEKYSAASVMEMWEKV